MKYSILILVAAVLINVAVAKPPRKVIEGEHGEIGEFPYQAMLKKIGKTGIWKQYCGATIIGPKHVLTAAHCVIGVVPDPLKEIVVITGTNANVPGAGVTHKIKAVTSHPDYADTAEKSWKNDIAVLTLEDNINFDAFQKSASLPEKDLKSEETVVASGWGDIAFPSGMIAGNIMKTNMNIVANDDCEKQHDKTIYESHLCAFAKEGTGLCFGDSGGPLASDGVVYGVASWVRPCARGIPDVFTRVSSYNDWIRDVMAKN